MSETKERLGDTYAGLSNGDWMVLRRSINGAGLATLEVARRFFQSKGCSRPHFNLDQIILAADSFGYGVQKYGEVGAWRDVPLDDHFQAAGRHFKSWANDNASLDESGQAHEGLFLARVAMACHVSGRETSD